MLSVLEPSKGAEKKPEGEQPLPASRVKPNALLMAIVFNQQSVSRNDWTEAKFCYQSAQRKSLSGGVHCLKGGLHFLFFLGLFNTKMSPDLLVNKAITEELIGGLFPAAGPQEAAVFRPP